MKIKTVIERECCDEYEDLIPVRDEKNLPGWEKMKFCKHCGQLWIPRRFTDAAGDTDWEYVRVNPTI